MRRFAGGACILAALAFSLPQVASAQTGGDLAIGYSYLAADGLVVNASSLLVGVFFGTSWRVSEAFSIAADINGHFLLRGAGCRGRLVWECSWVRSPVYSKLRAASRA